MTSTPKDTTDQHRPVSSTTSLDLTGSDGGDGGLSLFSGAFPMPPSDMIAGRQTTLLPIDELEADQDTYQRGRNELQVNKLALSWDNDKCAPPLVTPRSGRYMIIDGQQRVAAAKKLEHTHIWCIVVERMGLAREAEMFTEVGLAPKKLSAQDMYKAGLVSGEKVSVAIEEVLHDFKLTGKHVGNGEIRAIAKLREAFGDVAPAFNANISDEQIAHGKKILTWAIQVGQPLLKKGEAPMKVFSGVNLGALIWIRRNANSVPKVAQMRKIMARTTATQMTETAKAMRGSAGGSKRSIGGTRLAGWVNTEANTDLIDLDAHWWEELKVENDRRID